MLLFGALHTAKFLYDILYSYMLSSEYWEDDIRMMILGGFH